MKLTLEVYSVSTGISGETPSFGVRLCDKVCLESGALYDPVDINFLTGSEHTPAPETVSLSLHKPGEQEALAVSSGSFTTAPGHILVYRGLVNTATASFDDWYDELTKESSVYTTQTSVELSVHWQRGSEFFTATETFPIVLASIGARVIQGIKGSDGKDGVAPSVDAGGVDGKYWFTVTYPDGVKKTVEWRDGVDGDIDTLPEPVDPALSSKPGEYADAHGTKTMIATVNNNVSDLDSRLTVYEKSVTPADISELREQVNSKITSEAGSGLVPLTSSGKPLNSAAVNALQDFITSYRSFGRVASLQDIPFSYLDDDLRNRIIALEASSGGSGGASGGVLPDAYTQLLSDLTLSGVTADRLKASVIATEAESIDAVTGIWKTINSISGSVKDLSQRIESVASSSVLTEERIRKIDNSVQKDANGRGFSSNDFTDEWIRIISNKVDRDGNKVLSEVNFTFERAKQLEVLYNSSSELNPPVKPDENAKEGQPADAKHTYDALKGLSFTKAPDSYGSDWGGFTIAAVNFAPFIGFVTTPTIEWRNLPDPDTSGWYLCPFTFELKVPTPPPGGVVGTIPPGQYTLDYYVLISSDRNLTSGDVIFSRNIAITGNPRFDVIDVRFKVTFSRELYVYKDDSYVTKQYVNNYVSYYVSDVVENLPNDYIDDYEQLNRKPFINGEELVGDKSAADLKLVGTSGDQKITGNIDIIGNRFRIHNVDPDDEEAFDESPIDFWAGCHVGGFRATFDGVDTGTLNMGDWSRAFNVRAEEGNGVSNAMIAGTKFTYDAMAVDYGGTVSTFDFGNGMVRLEYTKPDFSSDGKVKFKVGNIEDVEQAFEEVKQSISTAKSTFHKISIDSEDYVDIVPEIGRTNYIDGVVRVRMQNAPAEYSFGLFWNVELFLGEAYGNFVSASITSSNSEELSQGLTWGDYGSTQIVKVKVTEEIEVKDTDHVVVGTILPGAEIEVEAILYDMDGGETTMFCACGEESPSTLSGEYFRLTPGFGELISSAPDRGGSGSYKPSAIYPERQVTILFPEASEKPRDFSLTITTDVIEEHAVTWGFSGGETLQEAFPGASKLAVGTTVWNVKEVAPGKLLVNRAPGASSGTVTITGDDGTAYTLAVDSEGTLEVRA